MQTQQNTTKHPEKYIDAYHLAIQCISILPVTPRSLFSVSKCILNKE